MELEGTLWFKKKKKSPGACRRAQSLLRHFCNTTTLSKRQKWKREVLLYCLSYFHLMFVFESEHVRAWAEGKGQRGRERNPGRLCTVYAEPRVSNSQTVGWPEPKSRVGWVTGPPRCPEGSIFIMWFYCCSCPSQSPSLRETLLFADPSECWVSELAHLYCSCFISATPLARIVMSDLCRSLPREDQR